MSFPALMVLLVVLTGLIWLMDKWVWAPKRGMDSKEPVIVEYARSFFPIILLVLVIRSFVVEPFRIPSASMLPTLHVGDFILVNKFSYGIRLPVTHTRIFETGTPERGDVIVFRYPENTEIDYIKRVVGLPGDRVGYFDKVIYINGEAIEQEDAERNDDLTGMVTARADMRTEFLHQQGYNILLDPRRNLIEGETVVPDGHFFVMGDNRDNSNDSRFWGTVPEENLVGRAFLIWMSWNRNAGGIIWSRVGQTIE